MKYIGHTMRNVELYLMVWYTVYGFLSYMFCYWKILLRCGNGSVAKREYYQGMFKCNGNK